MTEDHKADLDEMVAMLESAGLLIQTVNEGKPALQLTPKGAQVARQIALSSEDGAFAIFSALLDAAEADTSAGLGSAPRDETRPAPGGTCPAWPTPWS
jgi:hypothetical protein